MKRLSLLVFACAIVGSAHSVTVFDFEEFPDTSGLVHPGALTSLVSVQDGITMTVVRSSGAAFDVWDTHTFDPSFPMPLGWGDRALDPFFNESLDDYFIATFSTAMRQVDVEFTDFGGDDDEIEVIGFAGPGGSGTMLSVGGTSWGGNSAPNYAGVSVFTGDPGGILSIVFRGGTSDFRNSMYVDNIRVATVPEPATMAALALGALALMRRRRK